MNKRFAFLVVFGLVVSGVFAPVVQAAPVVVQVPIVAPQMVWYDDHQGAPIRLTHQAEDEISRMNAPYCPNETSRYLNLVDSSRISAILLWVPSGATTCNYLWVQQPSGLRWGSCVGKLNWGYDFGPGYNDNVSLIGVQYSSKCPAWSRN